MEEKERYSEHTGAWELPTGDSVTKGNYNLADIETRYIPMQTEMISNDKDKKIADIEVKLAEKDKRIKELKELLIKSDKERQMWQQMYKNADKINKNICETDIYPLQDEIKQLKQSQKQLAISELELVLKNFRNRPTYFNVARQEYCLSNQDKKFIDFINNQIKELKGEE